MLRRSSTALPGILFRQSVRSMSGHGRHADEHHHYLQVSEFGHSRTVVLDRPKALNSLNVEMCVHMKDLLRSWCAPGSGVGLFVMKGAGEKAFCAGESSPPVGLY